MKTVVITGGNRGLGLECARNIAAAGGWRILLACRDPEAAKDGLEKLRRETGNRDIEAWALDLASLASIEAFAARLRDSDFAPLGALVCNAGIQVVSGTRKTEDGFELTFGVNHLGHFLLANRLLDCLADTARIVFVSSGTHDPATKSGLPGPELTDARALAYPAEVGRDDAALVGRRRYTTSKLANLYTTYELARRLQGRGSGRVTANAFDPGMMPGTSLARDYGPLARFVWKYFLPALTLFKPGVNRVEDSGKDLARLVLAEELAGTTGKYFVGRDIVRSSEESYDEAKARDLWEASADLVGLRTAKE